MSKQHHDIGRIKRGAREKHLIDTEPVNTDTLAESLVRRKLASPSILNQAIRTHHNRKQDAA